MPLLDVKNLRVRFETHHGNVQAVDGVSFKLDEGETLGLVGESGSGKSVTNLALMGLIPSPPGVVSAESVRFGKRDLLKLSDLELRKIRGNEIAMIFQDPMTSLNPLLTVERQLTEVLMLHKGLSRRDARKKCATGLGDVGIPNPEQRLDSYPHELSGGMRQRVMIAMALLCKPRILIADEPTTALDVTIQAQILELMKELQRKHGTAIILVTHDLGVVAGMTDRINVMYAGRLAETASCDELFARPKHPYTRGLLASVPTIGGDPNADLFSIPGNPPDLASLPKGCAFGPRCLEHVARCDTEPPTLRSFDDEVTGRPRRAACFELQLATDTDPNRELFEALEQQEREGLDTGVMSWTAPEKAPQDEAPPEAYDEDDEEQIPSLMGGPDAGADQEHEPPAVVFGEGAEPPAEFTEELESAAATHNEEEPAVELAEAAPAVPEQAPEGQVDETTEVSPHEDGQEEDRHEEELFQDMSQDLEDDLDDDLDAEDPTGLFRTDESTLEPQPEESPEVLDLDGIGDLDDLGDLGDEDWKWIGEPPEDDDKKDQEPRR